MQVVCFFCMFSRREVLRFVFGALDPSMRGYLDETDFQVCLVVVEREEGEREGGGGRQTSKSDTGATRTFSFGIMLGRPGGVT